MNNKKGFTLVELIVSFALITAISIAFFRTILVLQQQQLKNIAINSYKAFTVVLNNSIQKDFLNDNIEKIISCGENCYDITYTSNGIVRLSIDKENNTITYGNIKEKLPKDFKFINNIEFTSYINSYEGNDSYVALNINLKSNYDKDIQNIKYVYQYDSDNGIIELNVDGAHASDIIEYLLYASPEENGLYEPLLPDGTSTGIRYRGENPNNYVYYNCEDKDTNDVDYGEDAYDYENSCEVWRIIGVFDVDNGKGNVEKRVKLVRNELPLRMSWDSSASDINDGEGVNQWGESTYEDGTIYEGADLMQLLNGYYLGKEDVECKYCSDLNEQSCKNNCSNAISPLSLLSLSMIDNTLWKIGSSSYSTIISLDSMYENERGVLSSKTCSSSEIYNGKYLCTDVVNRTTEWLGKIALIYPSDYAYASNDNECSSDIIGTDSTCLKENWLLSNSWYWFLTPYAANEEATAVWINQETKGITGASSYNVGGIRPSLYLKSNVTFIGNGTGTEDNPYILGINE